MTRERPERTVQFLIERACPEVQYAPAIAARIEKEAPFPVWVLWPALTEVSPKARCGSAKYFRVVSEDAEVVQGRFGLHPNRNDSNRVVCCHMGHVIE